MKADQLIGLSKVMDWSPWEREKDGCAVGIAAEANKASLRLSLKHYQKEIVVSHQRGRVNLCGN